MAIYTGDQPTTAPGVVNGVTTSMTSAVVKATVSAGALAYIFTDNFTLHGLASGTPTSYRKGVSYQLDPALKAALLAAGAPMVAL